MIFSVAPDPIQIYSRKLQKDKQQKQDDSTEPLEESKKKRVSRFEQVKLSFPFFVLYFVANYFNNASFSYTSVSSAIILQNASGLFSLLLGRIFGVEELSMFKIISVILTFSGVMLLKIFESGNGSDSLIGNSFALISAFLYGCYSTYLKKFVGEGPNELVPGSIMFGLTGIFSLILMWPGLIYLRTENLLPKPSLSVIGSLAGNAILGTVIANYAWTAAITFTSSLMVAVGLSFLSPVALIIDYSIGREKEIKVYKLASMALILIGFAFVNLSSIRPNWDRVILKRKEINKK